MEPQMSMWSSKDIQTCTRIKQYLSSRASPSWSRPPQKKNQHMKHRCFAAKLPLSLHDIGLVSRNAQPEISISSQTQHKLTIMWYFIDLLGVNSIFPRVAPPWCGWQSAASATEPSRCSWWRFRHTSARQMFADTQGAGTCIIPRRSDLLARCTPPAAPSGERHTRKRCLFLEKKRIESEVPRHFKIKLSLLSPFLSHGTPQDSGLNWQKSTLMKWPWA